MDPSAPLPPSAPNHTRAIRSFALREDAEHALAVLADSEIAASIREFRVPDPVTGRPVTRGCSLCIDPADTQAATRLLLKMAPSEKPAAVTAKPDGPTRLGRRAVRSGKQKSGVFIIGFAVVCAAGMIIFAMTVLPRLRRINTAPASRANVLVEEDLNGDTITDVVREYTWDWKPILHSEDRNYDSIHDHRWIYQNGKPVYFEVDLNFDGKFDERTTYDPEGQPFYVDARPGASGPVIRRKIFRDGIVWKILEDRDADSHFDHLTELDGIAAPVRKEELPKGSPENNPPEWPPPPAPETDTNEDSAGRVEAAPAP